MSITCRVTTLGGEKEYGEENVVANLDIGAIKVHEMEINTLTKLQTIIEQDDVASIEMESDSLARYDVHLTIICDDML